VTTEKRVWYRGKPVRGFFGGLVMGLGIALLGLNFKLYPLDDPMFTYFPLGSAVLCAARAYFGEAYKVEVGDGSEPAATEGGAAPATDAP
jgi:hypothetical protein